MTRFLDSSSTTAHEEKRQDNTDYDKQPSPSSSSNTNEQHDYYPTIATEPSHIGLNTRVEVLSGHYSDAHTRPVLSKQQYNSILRTVNDVINIPAKPTPEQQHQFDTYGYVELPNVLPEHICDALSSRIDLCLDGKFETNNYPDEWYFRKEICRPDITRHAAYIYKSDRGIAQVTLNQQIARYVTELLGIDGVKVGGDTLWVKPTKSSRATVSFHRDTMYQPPGALPMATVWITLTDVDETNGTLEYVNGSHLWPKVEAVGRDEFLQTKPDQTYRSNAITEAKRVGVDPATLVFHQVVMNKGGIVIHNGDTWHGSGPNVSVDKWRRNIGLHYGPHNAQHTPRDGYIHGRYKVGTDNNWNESFFPLTYRKDGYRSPWIEPYLNLDGEDTLNLGRYPAV